MRTSSSRPAPPRRQGGYTSVELLLVLALLGLFGGRAVPDLVAARSGANEAAALAELDAMAAAQTLFHDGDLDQNGILDYAPSLAALNAATGGALPTQANGYDFAIAAAGQLTWSGTAAPVLPGVTGAHSFTIDQDHVVTPTSVGTSPDATAILVAAQAVNELSLGVALDQVRYLVHSDLNDIEMLVLDTNGDGLLSFGEILDVDLLAKARAVQQHVHLSPGNSTIGDDAELTAILGAMQSALKATLSLGAGGEPSSPGVPISEPDDAADDFLGLVPEVSLAASIASLHGLLSQLDEQPFPVGDMPGKTVKQNQGRKKSLLRRTDQLGPLLAKGRNGALGSRLRALRLRSDGSSHPPDWIAGEAAARVLQQVNLSLRLLPPT